jgi:hypothetical protein
MLAGQLHRRPHNTHGMIPLILPHRVDDALLSTAAAKSVSLLLFLYISWEDTQHVAEA